MAVSTGTFADRIARIENGTTVQAVSLPFVPKAKVFKKNRLRPALGWLCILGSAGCVAYAWQSEMITYNLLLDWFL